MRLSKLKNYRDNLSDDLLSRLHGVGDTVGYSFWDTPFSLDYFWSCSCDCLEDRVCLDCFDNRLRDPITHKLSEVYEDET